MLLHYSLSFASSPVYKSHMIALVNRKPVLAIIVCNLSRFIIENVLMLNTLINVTFIICYKYTYTLISVFVLALYS